MKQLTVTPTGPLHGSVRVPGDKSISHRALLLGALADGSSQVSNFLPGGDCLATLNCLQSLGVQIDRHDENTLTIHGRGLRGLQAPAEPLNCCRSGTSMRLLTGILTGQTFTSTLAGDKQLLKRPMRRIVEPLRRMGAEIGHHDGRAPLTTHGRPLHGQVHLLPVASAQVKSALLLAGLYADGPTVVHQPGPARDHTERMLAAMGAEISERNLTVALTAVPPLAPLSMAVPGDISSAAFLLVAAVLVPGSEITIVNVGVNPTRTGLLDVLRQMGVEMSYANLREESGEPTADISVWASETHGAEIDGDTVVRMIDEFPALAVLATQAHGRTVVREAAELRVKETDRIAALVSELSKLGANIEGRPDGFVVHGPTPLRGGTVDSYSDHRLAMALAVAGLVAEGPVLVKNAACVADSFPGFGKILHSLQNGSGNG